MFKLLSWWCPLGHDEWHLPAIQFILAVPLMPILTLLSSRWTVPLSSNLASQRHLWINMNGLAPGFCTSYVSIIYCTHQQGWWAQAGEGTRTSPYPSTPWLQKRCITINVPSVYMARDVMILMREGHWKGWALKKDLFGPWNDNERSKCHLGPKSLPLPLLFSFITYPLPVSCVLVKLQGCRNGLGALVQPGYIRVTNLNCREYTRAYAIQDAATGQSRVTYHNCWVCLPHPHDFDAEKSISRATGRGGHWKSRLFWALKWQRAKQVPFGPKKFASSITIFLHDLFLCHAYWSNYRDVGMD